MLPTEWKLHAIISVFKIGDDLLLKTTILAVSLLSNISKALKRLTYIKICILDYYSRSISYCEFGFCKNISFTTTTPLYFNDLCSSKNKLTVLQIALSPDVKIEIKNVNAKNVYLWTTCAMKYKTCDERVRVMNLSKTSLLQDSSCQCTLLLWYELSDN